MDLQTPAPGYMFMDGDYDDEKGGEDPLIKVFVHLNHLLGTGS